MIDKIVGGFTNDATRLATLHNSAMHAMMGPSHPDTKARCTGDDEYAPLSYKRKSLLSYKRKSLLSYKHFLPLDYTPTATFQPRTIARLI